MKKVALLAIASVMMVGCSSSLDVPVTLVKGQTTVKQVEEILGSPQAQATLSNNKLIYDYTSSHTTRDITTGVLLWWQFLDNHVLTLCDKEGKNCEVFKAKKDEDAKSLRVIFEDGVVSDAKLLDL